MRSVGKNTAVIDKNELEELKKAAHDLAEENAQLRQKLDHMNELLLNAAKGSFWPIQRKNQVRHAGRDSAGAV